MTPGTQVRHPVLGDGVVVAVSPRGGIRSARVNFGYLIDWVPQVELQQTEQAGGQDASSPSPEPGGGERLSARHRPLGRLPEEVVSARRAVLALKLGQVLQENVQDLSVGTENAENALNESLRSATQGKPAAILVRGPYGAGKTHLLTMLAASAAREQLATASAILDGEGVTLADPMTILEPVLRSLCFPGESAPSGVGRRLAELRRRGVRWDGGRRRWSRIAEAVFQMPVAALDDPDVLEALEDYLTTSLPVSHANRKLRMLVQQPVQLPSIKAQKVIDRTGRFCALLGDWAEFCKAAGARGLVVIFDEVDVEYAATLWHFERRTRRQRLLVELDDLLGRSVPLVIAFGSAPATDAGAANDAARDLARHMPRTQQVDAPRPDIEQMRELGRRLCRLYSDAYPDWIPNVDQRAVERAIDERAERYEEALDPAPRRFVRELLEWLDVATDVDATRIDDA